MKKILSIIASLIMAITSVSLIMPFASADTTLRFNSKWGRFGGSIDSAFDIDYNESPGEGYYAFIKSYDEYKAIKSKGLVSSYSKSFFNKNVLLVNWLISYNGRSGRYENPEITKGTDGSLKFNYTFNMSYPSLEWVAYEENDIEFKKSDVSGIDFSKIKVNVTIDYSNATSNSEQNTIPDENITIKMLNVLNYTNTLKTGKTYDFNYNIGNNKNFYFVIDNYKDYIACGFTDKKAKFFKNHIILVNCIYGNKYTCDSFVNKGILKTYNNLIMSYNSVWKFPKTKKAERTTDIIELKKSEVKNVDFSNITVYKRNEFNYRTLPDGAAMPSYKDADSYKKLKMTYVDVSSVIAGNIKAVKNTKVKKLTLKSKEKKKIMLSWKNISGVKYEVKYSLKKSMKNAKVKKNIKKNKVTLKKLKSGKKYYVKVRAYLKIRDKIYRGKWSEKVAKKVK